MTITWYGQTCFRINIQRNRDAAVNILIDPPEKESGLRGPKLEADILLVSSEKEKIARGNYFLIDGPGEYEIKGVYIKGISGQGKVIYIIEAEEIKICHLGKLNQRELSSKQLEEIGEVDILFLPIGDKDAIDFKTAVKIMSQIEPKITIPMYYKIPNLKIYPVKSAKGGVPLKAGQFNWVKLEGLDKFLKAIGIKKLEPLAKLSIKKKDISTEEAKIIVLQP